MKGERIEASKLRKGAKKEHKKSISDFLLKLKTQFGLKLT